MDELVAFVTRSFEKGFRETWIPEGWNSKTLASRSAFLDEFEKQSAHWRSKAEVRYGLSEARLALGGSISLEERLACIEILKQGPPGRKAGHPISYSRDMNVTATVDLIARLGGIEVSRNAASEHESACSIVSRGLQQCGITLSEKRIAAIHTKTKASVARRSAFDDGLLQAEGWADEIYDDEASNHLVRILEILHRQPT